MQDEIQPSRDGLPRERVSSSDAGDSRAPSVDVSLRNPRQSLWQRSWAVWAAACAIAIAAGIAYSSSLQGAFVFDELGAIENNPTIRHLGSLTEVLSPRDDLVTVRSRPLLNLSFAVNYALGGLDVEGYHAVNLAIHVLAALLLFAILRRTFQSPRLEDRLGSASLPLALAISLLWVVHPLQTESVTYVAQRAESMMGFFYLATLYCVIRGAASSRAAGWNFLAVLACLAGMATKEVMVTAPLVVLLYDRQFLEDSWGKVFRRRWALYVGLAGTWALLVYLVAMASPLPAEPGAQAPTVFSYLRTQPEVILHYLRLSFWPHPLCLDYGWPIADSWPHILPGVVVVGTLLVATGWASSRRSAWAFLGAWFFLILAPTSSVLPLNDLAFEHRMYLPLAAALTAAVVGGYAVCQRLASPGPATKTIGVGSIVATCVIFGALTFQRNRDYASELSILQDTVVKAPRNPRVHNNLGSVLARQGKTDEAISHCRTALEINPQYADAHINLGNALDQQGKFDEAVSHYQKALELRPRYADAHYNFANALYAKGKIDEAIAHGRTALEINPQHTAAHTSLGNALFASGKLDEAIQHYQTALEINPRFTEAHINLAAALGQQGKMEEAINHCRTAMEINPQHIAAHYNLAVLLGQHSMMDEAIEHYRKALEINPQYAAAHNNLGSALYGRGQLSEAIAHWRHGLRLQPNDVATLNLAAWVLATCPDSAVRNGAEAVQYAQRACALVGNGNAAALDTLAAAYAEAGRFAEAVQAAQQALALAAAQNNTSLVGRIESRIRLYQSGTAYHEAPSRTEKNSPP